MVRYEQNIGAQRVGRSGRRNERRLGTALDVPGQQHPVLTRADLQDATAAVSYTHLTLPTTPYV